MADGPAQVSTDALQAYLVAIAGGGGGAGGGLNDLPMPGTGGMPDFTSMMNAVAPGAPGMGGFGGIPPVTNPEETFAQQLTQLEVGLWRMPRHAHSAQLHCNHHVMLTAERLMVVCRHFMNVPMASLWHAEPCPIGGKSVTSDSGQHQRCWCLLAQAEHQHRLQGMGFVDRQANIRALQGTGGDVNGAVERLLSGM